MRKSQAAGGGAGMGIDLDAELLGDSSAGALFEALGEDGAA